MEDRSLEDMVSKSFHLSQENWTVGKILERMKDDPDIDGSQIGNFETRTNFYATGIKNGFLTTEEIRKLERLPNTPQDELLSNILSGRKRKVKVEDTEDQDDSQLS